MTTTRRRMTLSRQAISLIKSRWHGVRSAKAEVRRTENFIVSASFLTTQK